MNEAEKILNQAVAAEIIDRDQRDKLADLFEQNRSGSKLALGVEEIDSFADEAYTSQEASELPRLVRGFHDVLITIGLVAALGGLYGLAGPFLVVVACWVLAEFFVKRQNLALPAFVLTVAFILSVSVSVQAILNANDITGTNEAVGMAVFFAIVVALILFYWRFRIPVALATLIVSVIGLCITTILTGYVEFDVDGGSLTRFGTMSALTTMVFAPILFFIAMRFDASDLERKSRNSDVAFWLHLCAAPMLLFSVLSFIFSDSTGFSGSQPELPQILSVIAIVVIMMLVGVIIDRRAFVTSGLISLGVAIYYLAQQIELEISALSAFAFLLVGLIVLTLGSGWQWMRRFLIGKMPGAIRSRVPSVAAG